MLTSSFSIDLEMQNIVGQTYCIFGRLRTVFRNFCNQEIIQKAIEKVVQNIEFVAFLDSSRSEDYEEFKVIIQLSQKKRK
jgi:hypothetical protein